MKISVISPVCERPEAFTLTEKWMARQTLQPDEWIVADGGAVPARCTLGQIHLHNPKPTGTQNLCHNILHAIDVANGDIIIIFEDDWYAPTHIATLVATLDTHPDAWLAGHSTLNYYHVAQRRWRTMNNSGASLSQTALRRCALPLLEEAATRCLAAGSYAIDRELWILAQRSRWALTEERTCIGIKGMPGPRGLGKSGYPNTAWHDDPRGHKLREWIGDDAGAYEEFRTR